MQPSKAVVGVVDYQAGNIQSIVNALEHLGASVCRVDTVQKLADVSHLVLPGVGAFGFCAEQLRASGLIEGLERWALVDHRPMLGICVGMQLLADSSDELGFQQGLGWGGGIVRRLRSESREIRVPHVGWNSVTFAESFGDFSVGDAADFYFDHSYAFQAPTLARSVASCMHGQTFAAVIRRDKLIATQFHPEKSQTAGMRLLRGFLDLVPDA